MRVKRKHEIVKRQRSLDFLLLGSVFFPPFQKKRQFGHVLDSSGICPGCLEGLSIGYLRLSAGQNHDLGFPGNRTGC